MTLVLWWVIAVIVGSFISGMVKSFLGVEIISKTKYGERIYGIVDSVITMLIGYVLLSAVSGHWLK